jgi:rubrerythrin
LITIQQEEEMAFKSEQALRQAIEMEQEGKRFYFASAGQADNILARKVFEELAAEEDLHILAIKRIYATLEASKPLKEWVASTGAAGNLDKVFQESLVAKAKTSETDIAALRFALELEDKSVKYYEALVGETEDPFERRFFMTLSFEERGHYLRVLDSIEYLTDPAGWHYVRERAMVDGG